MKRTAWTAILGIVLLGAALARADDADSSFDEYARLSAAARAAHERLDDSPPDQRTWLLEEARAADLACLAWLNAFTGTDAFRNLTDDQRGLVLRDRDRTGYNLAGVLLALERCDEAESQVARLLDTVREDELRPLIADLQEEATACLRRQPTLLVVDCNPPGAQLSLDGEPLGSASSGHLISREPHQLIIQADGYASETMALDVDATQSEVRVGPIHLVLAEAGPLAGPEWYEWSLWGAGAVGIGVGIVLITSANGRERELRDIKRSGGLILDPQGEQAVVDNRRLAGALSLTAGGISAAAGTALFLIHRHSAHAPGQDRLALAIAITGASLRWSF